MIGHPFSSVGVWDAWWPSLAWPENGERIKDMRDGSLNERRNRSTWGFPLQVYGTKHSLQCYCCLFTVTCIHIFYGDTYILQYFGNAESNSADPDAFNKVLKVTNTSELGDTNLTWDSPRAIRQIEHGLKIYGFRTNLARSSKFLQPERNLLNPFVIVMRSTVILLYVMALIELVKHIFRIKLHSSVQLSNHTWRESWWYQP